MQAIVLVGEGGKRGENEAVGRCGGGGAWFLKVCVSVPAL